MAWLQRWARWGIFALVILMPLIFLSPDVALPNPTDMPRRLLLALVAGLLLAGVCYGWSSAKQVRLHRHALDIAVLAFLLGAVIAGVLGAYPNVSLFSALWVQDFTTLPALAIGVALYFGVKEFIHREGDIEDLLVVMVLVGGVVALIGLVDYFGHLGLHPAFTGAPPAGPRRLVATLGNPMFTATFFAMCIPPAISVLLGTAQEQRRTWMFTCLALMGFALLLTATRSAWIGLAVAILLLIVLVCVRLLATRQVAALAVLGGAGLLIIAVLAAGLLLPQVRQRIGTIFNRQDETRQTRLVYMAGALNAFRARPLTGWGPGTLRQIYPQFRPSSHVLENNLPLNRGYSAALPHNLLLQTAAEMGVIGLLPFLAILLLVLITGCRLAASPAASGWLAMGLTGMLLANLISNLLSFDNAATMGLFWIGLSLLAALTAKEAPVLARVAPPRWMAPALAAGVVIVVCMQMLGTWYLAQGINTTGELMKLAGENGPEATRRSQEAVDDFTTALTLVPLPDYLGYATLTMAYSARATVLQAQAAALESRQQDAKAVRAEVATTRAAMFRAGTQVLRIFDREAQVPRLLISEYLADGRIDDARALASKLLAHEPKSSEVRLLYAQVLYRVFKEQGKTQAIPEALQQVAQAEELDATNPDIPGARAHLLLEFHQKEFQDEMAKGHDLRANPQVAQICADYEKGWEMLKALTPPSDLTSDYHQEFATMLFLQGETPRAVAQALAISDPQQQCAVRDIFTQLGAVQHRQTDAMRAAEAINRAQAIAATPAPAPQLRMPRFLHQ